MKALGIIAGLTVLSSAASAQTSQAQPPQPQPQQQAANAQHDPANDVVCERQQDTGTRLSSHKICHTRAQWQQLRYDDRDAIEKIQRERPMNGN